MAQKIFSLIKKKEEATFHRCQSSLDDLLQELNTPSLFGGRSVVFFDEIQSLKPLTPLIHYISSPTANATLILGATSMKPLADLYQKGKKEMVVLDLSEEKPWDKERRLQDFLIANARLQGKNISSDVASFLTEKIGPDMAALSQELDKLICFTNERPSISLSDAKTLTSSLAQVNSWQLAEKVIWHKQVHSIHDKLSDLSFSLLFVGQLRYHLQLGYKISSLLTQKKPVSDIAKLFPQIRSLDKYLPIAKERQASYFHQGLLSLYQMELSLKSTQLDPSALFDQFLGSLYK